MMQPGMIFESLANELILDTFEYFNASQLLHAFHGLNSRLNDLIYLYFQHHPLDFRSVSKQDFDRICQKHLHSLAQHVVTMHLSNDDNTPEQSSLFFSYGFRFEQFTQLESLSLDYINSIDLISNILSKCPDLAYLKLSNCNITVSTVQKNAIFLNYVWNLKKLKHVHLDMPIFHKLDMTMLTATSSSLESLTIVNNSLNMETLIQLFHCTSGLRYLDINIDDSSHSKSKQNLFPVSLLSNLTITFTGSCETLKNLLKNMPNLSELIIHTESVYIDGYAWEQILTSDFCQLKVFRLLMCSKIDTQNNLEEDIDRLLESFQTKFWALDRRCLVRCDYNTENRLFCLYTIPYRFKRFHGFKCDASKSICFTEKDLVANNYVNTLVLDRFSILFASKFPLQFSNIHHLELSYPFNDTIVTILPRLDRLTTLELISCSDSHDQSVDNLRELLNQAVRLYSVTIDYLTLYQLSSIKITNTSIRQLDLIANDGHFYGSECIPLIQSFLGDRCEVLLINIENRFIILDLIKAMPNLRALTCQSQDDLWDENTDAFSESDECMTWLRHRLSSTCLISRDESELTAIRIWIR